MHFTDETHLITKFETIVDKRTIRQDDVVLVNENPETL
jgi:hypothetical protein